ncbi:MAG: hypothetical protein U9O49_03985 [Candidatus Thermoplasmatota archaeon]|nr:hypothetical protein [Candidatus Thermoplasmatota archaeon]
MFSDDTAVLGLPSFLVVSIIVTAAVLSVFSISVYHLILDSEYDVTCSEIDLIISEAENMYEYANEGTLKTMQVEFPSSLKFAVFGGLPKNGNSEPEDLTLDENTSNNYYFVTTDGSFSGHSNVFFSGYETDQIAVLHYGAYDVNLELVKDENGKTYVKIY